MMSLFRQRPAPFLALFAIVATVVLAASGCDDGSEIGRPDDVACRPPYLIDRFCGSDQRIDECDCIEEPLCFEAYVDPYVGNGIFLVSSIDDYGNGRDGIRLRILENHVVEAAATRDDWPTGYPIRAKVTDAYIRKEMLPGNGVLIPAWFLEVETADQVACYHVIDDTTEVLLVP